MNLLSKALQAGPVDPSKVSSARHPFAGMGPVVAVLKVSKGWTYRGILKFLDEDPETEVSIDWSDSAAVRSAETALSQSFFRFKQKHQLKTDDQVREWISENTKS